MMKILTIPLLAFAVLSCAGDLTVSAPDFGDNSLIAQTSALSDSSKLRIEGSYSVEGGEENFGRTVVAKWNGKFFSFFAGTNSAYVALQGGRLDSTLVFEGYWRYAQDLNTGLLRLRIDAQEGGRELSQGMIPSVPVVMRGSFGDGSSQPTNPIVLRFVRPLSQRSRPFWIIAHRGGGRNSDLLPESENSLGIIQIAEGLGANGVEIDVRLTKDGIPVIYHDENLNPRLVKGEFCIGPIANYTYAHLRTLCGLKNGEQIPTLAEALETVVMKTSLSLVWLDIKSEDAIAPVIQLQRQYLQLAASVGRGVELLIGLPTQTAVDKYLADSSHGAAPAICELDLSDVRRTNAVAWAPAWTLGPMLQQVAEMHSEGRRVFFWTLDGEEFIRVFLKESVPDGMVTNYPSIVAYEYYVR